MPGVSIQAAIPKLRMFVEAGVPEFFRIEGEVLRGRTRIRRTVDCHPWDLLS